MANQSTSNSITEKLIKRGNKNFQQKGFFGSISLSRIKRVVLSRIWLARAIFLFMLLLFLSAFIIVGNYVYKKSGLSHYGNLIYNFIFTPIGTVEAIGGRTNILILGKGGNNHEAPDLTDTIIFFSIDHKNPSLKSVSIPRDIWVPELRAKINSAYYWGNQKKLGGGMILARSTAEQIVGEPIFYTVVIDFKGFEEIINILGGIEVDVKNGFIDTRYPIEGKENDLCDGDLEYKCRYETLIFEPGLQKMDGSTALKFSRSRNAQGDQGTDIARAQRQQQVLNGIKEKIVSRSTLLSIGTLRSLVNAFNKYAETDIGMTEASVIARRFLDARNDVSEFVLPDTFLENPPKVQKYDFLYVFVPKTGSWEGVHAWFECVLEIDTRDCGVSAL